MSNPKINYYEYIKSAKWRDFRKQILSIRKCCQKCLKTKNLNLHHRHYRTLGNETNDDIIVLCKNCHFKFHSKKKWKQKMSYGYDLDFTYTSEKNRKKLLYNTSEITRLCVRCGQQHPVFYRIFKNGVKTLSIACPFSKPRVMPIKFEEIEGVPILGKKSPHSNFIV